MDILVFETRNKMRVEISHAQIESSSVDDVLVGDHLLRINTPGGAMQIVLTPEQWGKMVDSLSTTLARRAN